MAGWGLLVVWPVFSGTVVFGNGGERGTLWGRTKQKGGWGTILSFCCLFFRGPALGQHPVLQ